MDSRKTSLLLLGLGLASQGASLQAAEIINGWQCERTPAGLWDCTDASGTIPTTPAKPAPPATPAEPTISTDAREPGIVPQAPHKPAISTAPVSSQLTQRPPLATQANAENRSLAASASRVKPQGDFALCASEPLPKRPRVDANSRRRTPMDVSADTAEVSQTGVSTFTGNVELSRADQTLSADKVEYNRDTEQAFATGNVIYNDGGIELKGEKLDLDIIRDKGNMQAAEYRLYDKHARGTAAKLERDNIANLTRIEKGTYTTCNADDVDWQLKFDKVDLDHDESRGTARNVSVSFMGVPFFYTPWMTFPLSDERKSGFLTPSIGNSDESGTEFAMPYYWNIAPNRDATITPRILSDRGLQLNGEYRYLHENSEGQVNIEALPDDDKFDDDRLLASYKHRGRFAQRWSTNINYNYASDKDYFEDLGTDISLTSTTHLQRLFDLNYQGDFWSARGRLEDYQTISRTAADQYARLPQLLFNMELPDSAFGLDYGIQAEAVAFDINDDITGTNQNRVTGTRLDLYPYLRYPFRNSWSFVTPKVGVRHTRYDLDDVQAGADDSPTRTIPILSVDSGLFFERDFNFANTAMLQTLEPRAYYLYVEEENQDFLITDAAGNDVVFDTGEYDFSFQQLFRENRFNGADRVGDANQLTLALTSRVIDPGSGAEYLKASLGQIFYFRDREVNLPGRPDEEDSSSAIVAEVAARFSKAWTSRAGIEYDPHASNTDKSQINVRYQPDNKRVANLSYRRRRADIEQTDLSVSWPLTKQFNLVGRWNYSLLENRTLEGFAGFEYESCCWIARLVARDYINDATDTERNTAVLLQLELKGLTSFGDGVKTFLERGILGYGRDDLY